MGRTALEYPNYSEFTHRRSPNDAEIRSLYAVYDYAGRQQLLKTLDKPVYKNECERNHHEYVLFQVKQFCRKPEGTKFRTKYFPMQALDCIKDDDFNRMSVG